MRRGRIAIAVGAASAVVVAAVVVLTQGSSPAAALAGDISLEGCSLAVDALHLTATPISLNAQLTPTSTTPTVVSGGTTTTAVTTIEVTTRTAATTTIDATTVVPPAIVPRPVATTRPVVVTATPTTAAPTTTTAAVISTTTTIVPVTRPTPTTTVPVTRAIPTTVPPVTRPGATTTRIIVPPPPLAVGRARPLRAAAAATSGGIVGHLSTTSTGLHVVFPGATRGAAYRLVAQLGNSACRDATWVGPPQGLVIGGGTIHISVVAHAQLQVYAGAPNLLKIAGVTRDNWATQDDVTPVTTSPQSTLRQFRWSSTTTGVTTGTWEVATSPFGNGCGAPAGLVDSGTATFHPGPLAAHLIGDFSIDFGKIAAKLVKPPPGQPDPDVPHPVFGQPYTPTGTPAGPPTTLSNGGKQVSTAPPPQPQPIPYFGKFYVRVVPTIPGRPKGGGGFHGCDTASSDSVTIRYDQGPTYTGGISQLQILRREYWPVNSPDNPESISAADWDTYARFEYTKSANSVHLIWSSAANGTDHGEWQLSTAPFNPDTCADSAGLIATGTAVFNPGTYNPTFKTSPPTFDLDLSPYASTINTAKSLFIRVVPRPQGSANNAANCTGPPTNQVTLDWSKEVVPQCPAGTLPPLCTPPPPPPSAPVQIELVKYQPFHDIDQQPPFCFTAVADHTLDSGPFGFATDSAAWYAVNAGHSKHFAAGEQHICFTPPPPDQPSLLDQVVSFVVDAISFPAQLYELYKQIIPGIIGEILTSLGVANCQQGSSCYNVLYAAEEAGLAALGLPPSLPDAKAFLSDGEDYLAEQIAENSPVPKEAAIAAIDAVKDHLAAELAAATQASSGFSCENNWCVMDNGVRSPRVVVRVTHPASDSSGLNPPKQVCVQAGIVFAKTCAALPKQFGPGATITIALHFTPEMSTGPVEQHGHDALATCENPPTQLWSSELPCSKYAQDAAFGFWETQVWDPATVLTLTAEAGGYAPGQSSAQFTVSAHTPIG